MSIITKSKLINICSDNPDRYYKDIMDLNDDMYEQFKLAKNKGLLPNYFSAPAYAMWEITSQCPQNCVYCYNSSHKKGAELTSKQLFDVADQLIKLKLFNICITGGEPTLRPEYYDLIRYLASSGVLIGTILSGWGITKEKALKIGACAKLVQISLDGSKAETHDVLRKREGSFDDAIKTIKYFVDIGVRVNVSFAITKRNADDFPAFHELVSKLGVNSVRTQKLAISGRAKENEKNVRPSEEQYKKIESYIQENNNKNGLCPIEYGDASTHIKSGMDHNLAVLARITSVGDVGITPYFDIFFGNVKNENLLSIWNRMKNGWSRPEVINAFLKEANLLDSEIIDKMKNKLYITGGNING